MEILETGGRLLAERVSLAIEMGIIDLDNHRTTDHKDFIATAVHLIKEISTLNMNSVLLLTNNLFIQNNWSMKVTTLMIPSLWFYKQKSMGYGDPSLQTPALIRF